MRVSLPLGASDRLCCFILALPGPFILLFRAKMIIKMNN